ncbi:GLPGLI family protein [uncultured Flavobacterium sp.]|uniref:GLPGLI family protein n=1 Tax=uncultured Flavobacterium sp. TaxID=165435 RepID=UPI0030EB8D1B
MKKYLSLFLLNFFICCAQKSETNTFVYKKISTEKTEDIKIDRVKNLLSSIQQTQYTLVFNDTVSLFSSMEKVYKDSFDKGAILYGGGNTRYLQKKDTLIRSYKEFDFFGEKFLIKDGKNITDWKITSETKLINNFNCYKANSSVKRITLEFDKKDGKIKDKVTTIGLEAWFCPDFPFSYGPDEFYGLPGIVFEGYEKNGKVIFALESIILNSNEKINKIPKLKVKTEDEIFKLLKDDLIKVRN